MHFAWLRLKEGEHQAVLRIAIEGTVSIFREKFSHNSYFDEPIVRSVRSLLGKNDPGQKECLSSFELLAQKILAGDDISIENPGIVFRNLLSLKSFAPWSIMDIGNVSFPFVFRIGKEEDTLKSEDTTFTLKGCPVLCDKAGKLFTPRSITDGEDITPSSREYTSGLLCASGAGERSGSKITFREFSAHDPGFPFCYGTSLFAKRGVKNAIIV